MKKISYILLTILMFSCVSTKSVENSYAIQFKNKKINVVEHTIDYDCLLYTKNGKKWQIKCGIDSSDVKVLNDNIQ
jgi:hypothetical protein